MIEELLAKVKAKKFTIGIIGLGYVGLPLAWTFFKNGLPVIGFDIDEEKINNLKQGKPYIKHLGEELMNSLANSDKTDFTSDFKRLKEADAILMCVPTPLSKYRDPDMSYVQKTTETISKHLRKGQLVVLESTTYPGTTEEMIIPMLEKKSGLQVSSDFYVAYSPEREDPGNKNFNTAKIPKVVGGHCKDSLNLAVTMYKMAISEIVPVNDCKTAEAVKLTENIFRSVNIALVNELKIIYDLMGIDVHKVLDAAATKPFGFMKFTPGPGLGGHCIPIDPFYLTWKAKEFEKNTRFIELAGEINTSMPEYVVEKVIHALNVNNKPLNNSNILIVGLAYKPDIDDIRESPTFKILEILTKKGCKLSYYDPYVSEIPQTREHSEFSGMKSIEFKEDVVSKYDAVIISTNHSDINYLDLTKWSQCIIDSRNALESIYSQFKEKIFKA